MQISKPYKECVPSHLTQGFNSSHLANDWAYKFGTFLVAPFNAKVTVIRGVQNASDIVEGDNSFLQGGCGIRLQSTEDPTLSMVYWHCQDVFPVKVGDIVLQGQPVAMMGNTGFVQSGGQLVPYDIRLKPPYAGTHVHWTIGRQLGETYNPLDPSTLIAWGIPINYNVLDTIKFLLLKIRGFFK